MRDIIYWKVIYDMVELSNIMFSKKWASFFSELSFKITRKCILKSDSNLTNLEYSWLARARAVLETSRSRHIIPRPVEAISKLKFRAYT